MSQGLLSLLKSKVEREGYLKKAAIAKDKDEQRGNWQDRWFVLNGHTLTYYKQKGDSSAKGTIDLTAARIDPGDEKTNLPFTIRIAEAKQWFSYLQASTADECEAWLASLRKCAGYKVEKPVPTSLPKNQGACFCSFGLMMKANALARYPEHAVLTVDLEDRTIKLFQDGKLLKAHPANTLSRLETSKVPDTRSPFDDQLTLYSMTIDFRQDSYLTRKTLHMGNRKEMVELAALLTNCSQGNFQPANLILTASPIFRGPVEARLPVGDAATGSAQAKPVSAAAAAAGVGASASGLFAVSEFKELFAVILECRCLLFPSSDSVVPLRIVHLDRDKIQVDGKVALSLITAAGNYTLRLPDESARDQWLQYLRAASKSLKDQIDAEVSFDESKTASAQAPPSPRAAVTTSTVAAIPQQTPTFVATWGSCEEGQLGHRMKDPIPLPTVVEALNGKRVRHVSVGDRTCAVCTAEGHLYMWGDGSQLQLGLGESRRQSSSPYLVTSIRDKVIVQVACGRGHTLALTGSREVFSWGSNDHGQLGRTGPASHAYPAIVPDLTNKRVVSLLASASGNQSAALSASGELYVWGYGANGRLGTGSTADVQLPKLSPVHGLKAGGGTFSVQSAAMGADCIGMVVDSGALFVAGGNAFGQLGVGDNVERGSLVEVTAFSKNGLRVRHIAMGAKHTVALVDAAGQPAVVGKPSPKQAYSWGAAVFNGHTQAHSFPAAITALSNIASCAVSATHTLLVSTDGQLFAFGSNAFAELGNGQPHVNGIVKLDLSASGGGAACTLLQAVPGAGFSVVLCEGDAPAGWKPTSSVQGFAEYQRLPNTSPRMNFDAADDEPAGPMSEQLASMKIASLLSSIGIAAVPTATATATTGSPRTAAPAAALPSLPPLAGVPPAADTVITAAQPLAALAAAAAAAASVKTSSPRTVAPAPVAAIPVPVAAAGPAPPADASNVAAADAAGDAAAGGKPAKDKKRKPLWKEASDPTTGRVYYYHTKTRETRWVRPADHEWYPPASGDAASDGQASHE